MSETPETPGEILLMQLDWEAVWNSTPEELKDIAVKLSKEGWDLDDAWEAIRAALRVYTHHEAWGSWEENDHRWW
jgi:hypothetical protein